MNNENADATLARSQPEVFAGAVLISASLLCVLMMAHHPSLATHDVSKVAAEIADKAWIDRVVHGSLIALIGAQVFGYMEFCFRLGFARATVRAGMIAYLIGVGTIMGAAVIDGFVISDLGTHYAAARTEDLEALRHLLNLCGIGVRAFTSVAVVSMSVGFALWSVALLRAPHPSFWLGTWGLLLSAALALGITLGMIELNVHGAMIVVLCQTAWNLAVGVQLVRQQI